MPTRDELEEQTVADLRDLAAERDLEGRSSMSKQDLIEALADDPAAEGEDDTPRGVQPSDYDPPADPEPAEHAEAVAEGRTGLDPVLAERKAAAREAESATPEPPAAPEPDPASVRELQRIKAETRAAEEAAADRDVREGLGEV